VAPFKTARPGPRTPSCCSFSRLPSASIIIIQPELNILSSQLHHVLSVVGVMGNRTLRDNSSAVYCMYKESYHTNWLKQTKVTLTNYLELYKQKQAGKAHLAPNFHLKIQQFNCKCHAWRISWNKEDYKSTDKLKSRRVFINTLTFFKGLEVVFVNKPLMIVIYTVSYIDGIEGHILGAHLKFPIYQLCTGKRKVVLL
jgi:hypothetical protein